MQACRHGRALPARGADLLVLGGENGLGTRQRDAIEIAALLHDLGVIGAPMKSCLSRATSKNDEMASCCSARKDSLEILKHCCTSPEVLAIVENVSAWYDGSRRGFRCAEPTFPWRRG